MKNITLTAEDDLLERARLRAAEQKTTLNAAFREWLQRYAGVETGSEEYVELMKRLRNVEATRRFSRDELNER